MSDRTTERYEEVNFEREQLRRDLQRVLNFIDDPEMPELLIAATVGIIGRTSVKEYLDATRTQLKKFDSEE